MNEHIGKFALNHDKTTMKHGYLYTRSIVIPFAAEGHKRRTLRVWLPEDYDGNKRYPVIYMSDGQNIVNRYTTAFGDWNLSVRINTLQKIGHQGAIIVGLDCPKNDSERMREYSVSDEIITEGTAEARHIDNYADKTADFFVNTVKPLVDKTFMTKPDRVNTGFIGSSMGGIFAFHICTRYPKIMGFCGGFSPAFHIYSDEFNDRFLGKIDKNTIKNSKFYLYCGATGYEAYYPKPTRMLYDYLKEFIPESNIALDIDEKGMHSEKSWSTHFVPAVKFMIPKK